jgi:hypothetical protein
MSKEIYCTDSDRFMCPICCRTHIHIYDLYIGSQIVGACEKCLKKITKSIKFKLNQVNRDESLPVDRKAKGLFKS